MTKFCVFFFESVEIVPSFLWKKAQHKQLISFPSRNVQIGSTVKTVIITFDPFFLEHQDCETIYTTSHDIPYGLYQWVKSYGNVCKFRKWPTPDQQYLRIAQRILYEGVKRPDRTGTGTLSVFGERMEFDLSRKSFPLLTTKRVFWRGVVEELLWFLRGCTSARELSEKGVRIWDHYGKDDLGPIYGAQWVKQLPQVLKDLCENTYSRRHVVSAWNVAELDQMVLPPCHMMYQFYVDDQDRLSCQMYQRSADWALGVPFNMASYALLTLMVAQVTFKKPGKLIMIFGDTHLYLNHLEGIQKQLTQKESPLPWVELDENVKDLFQFEAKHIVLHDYHPDASISFSFAV